MVIEFLNGYRIVNGYNKGCCCCHQPRLFEIFQKLHGVKIRD